LSADATAITTGLSDHVPQVLRLELSRERTPQTWDEDAFTEEIGRRHGGRTQEVVEQLVNWADVRERALRTRGQSKGLTRFQTNGPTTDPELIWRLDLDSDPKAAMNLFSVHADGQVVIHFGGMRVAPFDAPAQRKEILRVLNGMEGVNIGEREVYRWPRFPIDVLIDPGNLATFVAALDRLAVEPMPTT
jgi:hypothetical protein